MILCFLILLFLLSLSLILFSVKIYISGEAEAQKILREEEEKIFQESGLQQKEKNIEQINQELSYLCSFYESQPNPSAFLQRLADILPAESYFTEFKFQYLSMEEGIRVELKGFTPGREVLSQLKNNLEKEQGVYDMNFSDKNWTNPDNFELNFKIKI